MMCWKKSNFPIEILPENQAIFYQESGFDFLCQTIKILQNKVRFLIVGTTGEDQKKIEKAEECNRLHLITLAIFLHAYPREVFRSTINDLTGSQTKTMDIIDQLGAKIYESTKKSGNGHHITYGLTDWYYNSMIAKEKLA